MSAPPFDLADPGQLAKLAREIARLPRREREVFEAVAVGRLGHAEAAARLNITLAQVERRLARALRRLDRRLHG